MQLNPSKLRELLPCPSEFDLSTLRTPTTLSQSRSIYPQFTLNSFSRFAFRIPIPTAAQTFKPCLYSLNSPKSPVESTNGGCSQDAELWFGVPFPHNLPCSSDQPPCWRQGSNCQLWQEVAPPNNSPKLIDTISCLPTFSQSPLCTDTHALVRLGSVRQSTAWATTLHQHSEKIHSGRAPLTIRNPRFWGRFMKTCDV